MKKRIQKLLSLMLTLILVVGMIPMTSLPAFAAEYTVVGVSVQSDGVVCDDGWYYLDDPSMYLLYSDNSSMFASTISPLYTDEECIDYLTSAPVLGGYYYFQVFAYAYNDTDYSVTNSKSSIDVEGFCSGRVEDAYKDGSVYIVTCSIIYGELTGGVKAVASGVAYDSAEGGYAPTFTTLKAVSTTGKELEHIMVDGKYSYYGAKSGCLYKTNSGTSFSDMLTTAPQVGETYYSYIRLDSINGNLNIEEDLVDIQIPGYKVEYLASYERDMGFTSMVVYKATKVPVCVGGVGMKDGDYLAVGASKTQTTKPSGGYAYYKDGTLTLNNYSYEGKGYLYNSYNGYYATVFAEQDLTLGLIGNNTLNQTESYSFMIYVDGANLTVGGDGKLTGTSASYGLCADKDLTINGGTVEVSTESTCILSSGDLIINDGDITAESKDRIGIWSAYDITINGGNVTATGDIWAIGCSGLTVAKDLKIQASTTADGELGEYVSANHNTYKKIVIAPTVYHSVYFCFGDSPVASQDIENGKCAIRPEDPYQEGKSFMGWYTKNGEEYDFETPVTGELYLYAKFGYDVLIWLDVNDEYPVAGYTAEEGTIINEPAEPGQENKRFIGWYTDDGTKYDFSKPLTGHVNLYARFECIHNYVSGKCEHCGEAAPVTIKAPVIKSSSVSDTGKIKLTWATVEGAAKYRVYRATSKTGKYSIMKTVEGTSYINSTAKAGTRYYYYVVAIDANGVVSEKSNIVGRTCDLPRPTVTLSNVASTGKIKVAWTKVDGAAKYQVYRSTTKNGTYSLKKTTTSLSWTDTNTTAGKTYYYKVKAVHSNTNANSALTAYKSRMADLKRPTVSITTSSGKPKVSWAAVTGATKYQIYRSTSKTGTYKVVKTTTAKYWKDTTAVKGKTYYYKVVAVHSNTNANSAYSTVKSIKCTK